MAEEVIEKPAPRSQKPTQKAPATAKGMIKVYNPQQFFYLQPSTHIKVKAKSVTEIKDDNWAELQISAGILEKAK